MRPARLLTAGSLALVLLLASSLWFALRAPNGDAQTALTPSGSVEETQSTRDATALSDPGALTLRQAVDQSSGKEAADGIAGAPLLSFEEKYAGMSTSRMREAFDQVNRDLHELHALLAEEFFLSGQYEEKSYPNGETPEEPDNANRDPSRFIARTTRTESFADHYTMQTVEVPHGYDEGLDRLQDEAMWLARQVIEVKEDPVYGRFPAFKEDEPEGTDDR